MYSRVSLYFAPVIQKMAFGFPLPRKVSTWVMITCLTNAECWLQLDYAKTQPPIYTCLIAHGLHFYLGTLQLIFIILVCICAFERKGRVKNVIKWNGLGEGRAIWRHEVGRFLDWFRLTSPFPLEGKLVCNWEKRKERTRTSVSSALLLKSLTFSPQGVNVLVRASAHGPIWRHGIGQLPLDDASQQALSNYLEKKRISSPLETAACRFVIWWNVSRARPASRVWLSQLKRSLPEPWPRSNYCFSCLFFFAFSVSADRRHSCPTFSL